MPAGSYLTMTATRDSDGGNGFETSEFSACMQVAADDSGPVVTPSPTPVPTLGHAALALLSVLLAALGITLRRAR